MSSSELAMRAIRELIQRKAWGPGQKLPAQRELAVELNVSRPSLREALSSLEALGLVRTAAGRGTFVTDAATEEKITLNKWRFSKMYEPREVYEFRYYTESAAVRLAALNITDEEIGVLATLHSRFKEALNAFDVATSASYDYQFHRTIMACSRNRVFVDLYDKFEKVFQQTQILPFSRLQRRWEAVVEHGKILDALRNRDPDGAAYFLETHLLRATERIGLKLSVMK